MQDNLAHYLKKHIQNTASGKHHYEVDVIRTKPVRSYAVFPHAKQPTPHIYVQNIICLVQEQINVEKNDDGNYAVTSALKSQDNAENKSTETKSTEGADTGHGETKASFLPLTLLEAALYTIPKTSTMILYISKIDTAGLVKSKSMATELATAFISYHLMYPGKMCHRLRVQLFTSAQQQYVFLGSSDNPQKRPLDDRRLASWWKRVLTDASRLATHTDKDLNVAAFYIIPGYSELEARQYVPESIHQTTQHWKQNDNSMSEEPSISWVYGHPYDTVASPFEESRDELLTVPDMIPAFTDDPKARYLCSLSDSIHLPAGEDPEQDWDGHTREILSRVRERGEAAERRAEAELNHERNKERQRILKGLSGGDVNRFWKEIAWRQECCNGKIVSFMFLESTCKNESLQNQKYTLPLIYAGAIPSKGFAKWLGQIKTWDFGINYVTELIPGWQKLMQDIHSIIHREGVVKENESVEDEFIRFVSDNPERSSKKHSLDTGDAAPIVHRLVPKKKKKTS